MSYTHFFLYLICCLQVVAIKFTFIGNNEPKMVISLHIVSNTGYLELGGEV